jgi:GPH family glycoside/pentoside/hexuronide:cation symporter
MSFRVYILSGSQFVAGGLCPVLVQTLGGGARAYSLMAMIMAVYLMVVAWTCFAWTRDAPATQLNVQRKGQFWKALPTLFASRSYVALLLCKYFFLLGSTAHTATAAFYVKYVMHARDSVLGLFLLVYSVGMVVSQPLWLWLGRRIGKAACFSVAAALYAAISLTWAAMQPHLPQALFMVLSFANGFGAGGSMLMSQSMAPDAVDEDFHIRGIRREGSLMSFIALAEKGASASGLALVGIVLSRFHYAAPAPGQSLSGTAQQGIVMAFGVAPAVFFGVGAAWLLLRGRSSTPVAAVPVAAEASA